MNENEWLSSIFPNSVVAFLHANNWQKDRDFGRGGAIFTPKFEAFGDEQKEALFITSQHDRGYSACLSRLIDDLCEYLSMSQFEVRGELQRLNSIKA